MKDTAQIAAITTSVPSRSTNPINTNRPGAHRDRRAAAPREPHRQPARPPGITGGGTAITTGTSLPHVLPRAGLIDINGHDSPHSPTQRTTLIPPTHRDHIVRTGLLGLLDTANRSGRRKTPRPLSPTPRCDKSVTTRPAAVITDRPASRGESPVQRLVSGCERDARPPSTDVRVTTRRELLAAIRASDSGQNTQVRAGFAPGNDAAIPGRR
jgi:hypothetical protein